MRIVLWLCLFVLRRVVGAVIYIVVIAIMGRGPAARYTLVSTRLLRRMLRM